MKLINCSNKGFSLIEVIVALSLFTVVLMISTNAFRTILTQGSLVQRSEESNVAGLIGLEVLRHDIAQAGLGLFTEAIDFAANSGVMPTYPEAVAPADVFNDTNARPRAIVTRDNPLAVNLAGTDHIAIKATTLGTRGVDGASNISQLNTYITATGVPAPILGQQVFPDGAQVIAIDESVDPTTLRVTRKLVMNSDNNYAIKYRQDGAFVAQTGGSYAVKTNPYTPRAGKRYVLRGISGGTNNNGAFTLSAPFNRTDFFVRATQVPTHCAPGTGVLYKGIMSQDDGIIQDNLPILDCVANMQVVLGWNTTENPIGSKLIDGFSDANGMNGYLADPEEIRTRLRQVRIYILAQDGNQDRNFRNTITNLPMTDDVAYGTLVGPVMDLTTPNRINYRWKLHKVVVDLMM